jgi:hypothetical protein
MSKIQMNQTLLVSFEKSLVDRPYLHGPWRAGRYTQFTYAAFFLIKNHLHFGPLNRKGTGRAYCRTGSAIRAFAIVTLDFLRGVLDLYSLGFKKFYALSKIFLGTRYFKHRHTLFAGQDGSIEDVEHQVEILGQMIYNRLVHFALWKA